MTMTTEPLLTRTVAARMTNNALIALVAERGLTSKPKPTKADLLDLLFPEGDGDDRDQAEAPAETPERTKTQMAAGAPVDPVEVARRFLAEPTAEDQETLRAWAAEASPDEYERVMAEAAGRPAYERPKPEAGGPEPETAIEKWKRASDEAVEIEPYRPTLLPGAADWNMMQAISQAVATGVTLPEAIRQRPADVLLLLLAGHDVGLKPTVALNKIHIIDGTPSMSAEVMRALVLDRGHLIRPLETSPTKVVMYGRRKGWAKDEGITCEWTIERAQRVKFTKWVKGNKVEMTLADKDTYHNYPEAMLAARASSELCRLIFPDVLAGISYTPEELGAEVDAAGVPVMVESTATTAPPPTPDEAAQAAGWESVEEEGAAHRALMARLKALPEEQKATARTMLEEAGGFPIRPRSRFDGFVRWVDGAEGRAAPASESPEDHADGITPVAADASKAERMAAAQAALDAAAASGGGTVNVPDPGGLLSEAADAELVCPVCGVAGPSMELIQHEEGCPHEVF